MPTHPGGAMPGHELLISNLLSPIVLAFALGAIAGAIRSELELPEPVLKLLAIYLLLSLGLKGGVELGRTPLAEIAGLLVVPVALTIAIPVVVFTALRRVGGFDTQNAAAVAAHYGSVSSVTFFAAIAFAKSLSTPSDGYVTAVVAIMEWGVVVALLLARWTMGRENGATGVRDVLVETLRGRGILLLSGGMTIGLLSGDAGWAQISPPYDDLFRGVLMLFLLEMGMTAARRVRAFREVGVFMTGYAILAPIAFGLARRDVPVRPAVRPAAVLRVRVVPGHVNAARSIGRSATANGNASPPARPASQRHNADAAGVTARTSLRARIH